MSATKPLSRERFVENALYMGLSLATRGALGNPDVHGDLRAGTVKCEDGQGSDFLAMWNSSGVVVLVHDHYTTKYEWRLPNWPAELNPLVAGATPYWRQRATGGLWIMGTRSESTLQPADPRDMLHIVDDLCDASWAVTEEKCRGVDALREAIARDDRRISADLARILLRAETTQDLYPACSGLDAGRRIAADLEQFGFQWPELELHVRRQGEAP